MLLYNEELLRTVSCEVRKFNVNEDTKEKNAISV